MSKLPSIPEDDACKILTEWLVDKGLIPAGHPLTVGDLSYHCWPQTFGSTSGPFGGIGGAAMTDYQMEAWDYMGVAMVFCCGKMLEMVNGFTPATYHYQR